MTVEIIFMLLLLLTVITVLAAEWLPVDLTALLSLISLVVAGVLRPDQAFSGFVSEIIFVLASVFIMSAALAKSGLTYLAADLIVKFQKNRMRLASFLMILVASISAFFSNTSATGVMIPVTLQTAQKAKINPSKLLMPLAFASILGGTCTLIGTSTNLASAGLIERLGMEPFSLFEFIVPGLILTVIGILYMSFVGNRLIPKRAQDDHNQEHFVRDYLSELIIDKESPTVDKTLGSLKLARIRLTPLTIVRKNRRLKAHGNMKLKADDKILIKGPREALLQASEDPRFSVAVDTSNLHFDSSSAESGVSEFIIMPHSRFIGRTIKRLDLSTRFQVSVLAIYRRESAYTVDVQKIRLKAGDVLLLQGAEEQLDNLAASFPELWVSQATIHVPLSIRRGLYVLAAMALALLLTSTSILPPSIAFLIGVVALVLTRCTTMEEAYDSIEWRLLVLIACMSSLGLAMQETGTAEFLAEQIVVTTSSLGPYATLAALALLTVVLTQPMSNAAAALVLLPVAAEVAGLMNVDARPFVVIVTLSASLSFITPLEPASLLVYSVGKYRFTDFIRVGVPLTLIVISILVVLVPELWPF